MSKFNIFVIKSGSKYYYSTRTDQEFMDSGMASIFRSEKNATAQIRKAIRGYEDRKTHLYAKNNPDYMKRLDEKISGWKAAKVVELNIVD